MNFSSSEKPIFRLSISLFLLIFALSVGVDAQSRKGTKSKAVAKKTAAKTKDAKKDTKKDSRKEKQTAKNSRDSKKKADSKKDDKKKLTAKERREQERAAKQEKASKKDSRKKVDPKKLAEERREAAARRRAEEERRQAILAERRRREQAAREARARKLAFERGLRTATVENIANDSPEGEDPAIRRAAVNALGSHAGTVVVMEAQTGKVVTIVNQDWAIRDSFKPCSTIKLVTGVAGINERVINESGGIGESTSGMDLSDALARSNNGYFQRVGSNIGSSKMISYARSLGLGTPTGINVEGETAGKLPFGNNNARIYSHGDDFEVTPLQLAVMVSAIANGGKKVVPQVARQRGEKIGFQPQVRESVNLPTRNLQGVIPGMIGAAEYGTARRGVDASMGVAGKTGSCISKGSWVGLFASVAPIEQPKYSVVVITRGQSERGKYAAAIAGKIYSALAPRLQRGTERNPAFLAARPKPPVNTAIADEDEEDDVEVAEAGAADEAAGDKEVIVAGSAQRPAVQADPQRPAIQAFPQAQAPVRKLVTRTSISKPKFAPVVITYDKDTDEQPQPKATRPRIVKNK